MTESIIVDPDPKRLIEGLRDTGYNFCTAVADLIDNSIAAEATRVNIRIEMDYSGNIDLMIADNGCGMNRDELITAMKYGSPQRPNPRSLGKFGLGLKTASTAFCKRLSVISRADDNSKALKAIWDLDHVAQKGAWELLISEAEPEELNYLDETTNQGRGTLVRWEKVDRLLKEYSEPSGRHARNALNRRIDELVEHVSMVYQRFLNDSDQREDQNVQMWINDSEIKPWDPFCTNEAELTAQNTIPIGHEDNDDVLGEFSIRAFVLPRRGQYSSDEVEKSAKISNDRQGFYIYRENRLIHHADWLGMYSKEPHFSLLRVEFSFGAELDEAFQVDIKKSKISLADELYRWLKEEFLPTSRQAAQQLYRKGVKVGVTNIATGAHDASNKGIGNTEKDIPQATVNVIDPDSDEVDVSNSLGTTRIKLKIGKAKKPGEVYVQPVDGIDDGLLWQPAYIDEHQAVQINTGHQFYRKVYVPNIQSNGASPINVQGLDSLLWALSVSELKAVNADTRTHFEELRYDVSRILRKLVEDLPEPYLEDNNA